MIVAGTLVLGGFNVSRLFLLILDETISDETLILFNAILDFVSLGFIFELEPVADGRGWRLRKLCETLGIFNCDWNDFCCNEVAVILSKPLGIPGCPLAVNPALGPCVCNKGLIFDIPEGIFDPVVLPIIEDF